MRPDTALTTIRRKIGTPAAAPWAAPSVTDLRVRIDAHLARRG